MKMIGTIKQPLAFHILGGAAQAVIRVLAGVDSDGQDIEFIFIINFRLVWRAVTAKHPSSETLNLQTPLGAGLLQSCRTWTSKPAGPTRFGGFLTAGTPTDIHQTAPSFTLGAKAPSPAQGPGRQPADHLISFAKSSTDHTLVPFRAFWAVRSSR